MKKMTAFFLCLLMVFALAMQNNSRPANAETKSAWTNASGFMLAELREAQTKGLLPEILDGVDFTAPVTRAELAHLLVLLCETFSGDGLAVPAAFENPFADTKDPAVLKAFASGIMGAANEDGTMFSPSGTVFREDMALMMCRAIDLLAPGADLTLSALPDIPDESEISSGAAAAVRFLYSKGIVIGGGGHAFMPRPSNEAQAASGYGTATREQCAVVALKIFNSLPEIKSRLMWAVQDPFLISAVNVNFAEPEFTGEAYETVNVGGGNYLLHRFPLPAGVPAKNVLTAKFFIKPAGGEKAALRLAAMQRPWVSYSMDEWWRQYFSEPSTWDDIKDFIGNEILFEQDERDGWVSADVTGLVKAWLSGSAENNGVAFFADEAAEFYSIESEFCPRIEIVYAFEAQTQNSGKFGFAPQPPGRGNCMSYALRDVMMIGYFDLIDEPSLEAAYEAGGLNGALQYVKGQAADYVEKNKEALSIAGFREIESFDAPINIENEYRIAMRIGIGPERIIEGMLDFDYHFMMQLSDGTWAEKLPGEHSRVVSGSQVGVDPAAFPWNKGFVWGRGINYNGFYNSGAIYFAVEKSVNGFTEHKDPGDMW